MSEIRAMRFVPWGLAAVLLLATQASGAKEPTRVEFHDDGTVVPKGLPFSEAVRVGEVLYLSGQIGNEADGTLPAGIEAQSRQVMDNIGAVLKSAGLGFGDVVKCTVMIDDIKQWADFNKVYVTYFPDGKFPARSAFGADGLAMGALIEVECWAHMPK